MTGTYKVTVATGYSQCYNLTATGFSMQGVASTRATTVTIKVTGAKSASFTLPKSAAVISGTESKTLTLNGQATGYTSGAATGEKLTVTGSVTCKPAPGEI